MGTTLGGQCMTFLLLKSGKLVDKTISKGSPWTETEKCSTRYSNSHYNHP